LKTGYRTVLLSLFLSLLFLSCASIPEGTEAPVEDSAEDGMEEIRKDLVDSAEWALGRNKLVVGSRTFNMDCSGVVMAVYYRSGIDLQSMIASYAGGGVQRLYALMDSSRLLNGKSDPEPGDILFWDNTYDHNEDGRWNDELTHVGMVVRRDNRGNVLFIHHNYSKGIVLARMNLNDPDNLDLNSPMRAKNAEPGHAPLWLSSHLLRQAARGYELAQK